MHMNTPFKENKSILFLYIFNKTVYLSLLISICIFLQACAGKKSKAPQLPPIIPVTMQESADYFVQNLHPQNQNMRSWNDLAPSINKSLRYVSTKPQSAKAINRGTLSMTWGDMRTTLLRLKTLLPELDKNPQLFLDNFRWVALPKGIKYTGYYSPVVRASKTPKKGYTQPIYSRPPELGGNRPFFTRRQIDEGKLANRGLELAWAADPVDVFFLEVQGSGCLLLDDGSRVCINYDGQNGHKYKSSGRIMREKGLLKRGDIFEQRQWFKDHPDRVKEILLDNPSYVFFKLGGSGPTGAMGSVVDDWRSLATDRSYIPLGSIVAYGVNIPDQQRGTTALRGIGFAQDVGGAIKQNRIDIYCGSDDRANYVASFLDSSGPAWVLQAK